MIISLYENNLPMRFGVILFSTKFIKTIEMNGRSAPMENDSHIGEDPSSLVMLLLSYSLTCLSCLLAKYLSLYTSQMGLKTVLPLISCNLLELY